MTGLSGFIIRRRSYENERDRVLWWNHLHREQYEERILLGRQAVGVLGMSYITPVASNKLAAALLQEEMRARQNIPGSPVCVDYGLTLSAIKNIQ